MNAPTNTFDINSPKGVAIARGMKRRGDRVTDIAVWFSCNPGRVSEVTKPKTTILPDVPAAASVLLPPPGPYAVLPVVEVETLQAAARGQQLIRTVDVCRMLSVGKRTLDKMRRSVPDFPLPVDLMGISGNWWRREDIERWVRELPHRAEVEKQ